MGGKTPLKRTAFNSNEPIAIKFYIEIICPIQILMGYMRLEKFHNIWVLGDSIPLGGSMPPFYISPQNSIR